jgi:TRAP transporter 4TM/12TM fusion protein
MKALLKIEHVIATVITFLISLLVISFQATYFMSESRVIPLFLSMVLVYGFLNKPLGKSVYSKIIDWLFVIGSIVVGLYLSINFLEITSRSVTPDKLDVYMGIMAILIVLEALRRTVGWGITIISIIFLLYAIWGRHFPDLLRHRGYSIERLASQLYLGTSGLYGLPLATMFRYVVIFIIFGAVLEKTGVSDFMIDLSRAVAGRLPGGTGHVAVLSSGLMGSVSGSAVANVMVGGNVTIPAMKKSGFSGIMAGAIEAVSSNGGQILPPVMGAAAFLMAENLRIPYSQVAWAALNPGVLYFIAVAAMVHFYSVKNGIKGLPKNELPSFLQVLRSGWIYPIPFIVLVGLLMMGYSPSYSGLGATVAGIVCGFLNSKNRLTVRGLFSCIQEAGQGVVMLSIASAGAGIVIGVLTITGLGNRFASILVDISNNNLFILLLVSAIASIIMGMGMSTTVVYILLAALVAPALIDMGVVPIAAHLFILYFGTISMLTPPVALASYAAAAISGESPDKTGWAGFKIAIPAYIIPFCFVADNGLLMKGSFLDIMQSITFSTAGVILLTAAMVGYFKSHLHIVERILMMVSSLLLMSGNFPLAIVSVILLAVTYYVSRRKKPDLLQDDSIKV